MRSTIRHLVLSFVVGLFVMSPVASVTTNAAVADPFQLAIKIRRKLVMLLLMVALTIEAGIKILPEHSDLNGQTGGHTSPEQFTRKKEKTMKTNIRQWALSLVLSLVALSGVASAATNARVAAPSQLASKIQRKLVMLPYYSMFDNLGFRTDGPKVTLLGEVWWPNLKNSAERVVANVKGVTSVENQIEVLPTSFHDDQTKFSPQFGRLIRRRIRSHKRGSRGPVPTGGQSPP